ncbi:hypothetical protein AVEN_9176-1 [Araneus ventricosus]|uniref:Uncharacterized protein n=1 Tax=Araneus ventricosus TaxID=182803 RepID=A0A4Y2SL17_ARAVE|nr:hypothetical protein AVEN_9176-1 [Araneus ventricosus]
MFSMEDCFIQLATPVSTPGSRSSALSTTNCEEKKGEGGRVHFTNPHVNKTSVYKGSKILRAARSQRVKLRNTNRLLLFSLTRELTEAGNPTCEFCRDLRGFPIPCDELHGANSYTAKRKEGATTCKQVHEIIKRKAFSLISFCARIHMEKWTNRFHFNIFSNI